MDVSSNARTDIERATCHGHDLRHLQGENEEKDEEEDEEDEMQHHRCNQQRNPGDRVQRESKA